MSKEPALIVPGWLDDAGIHPYSFRALCHIARRAGGTGGLFYGRAKVAARACGMSPRQWWRAIEDLVARGFLIVVEEKRGAATTYRYNLCPTGTPTCAPQAHPRAAQAHGGVPRRHTEGVPVKESLQGNSNPPHPPVPGGGQGSPRFSAEVEDIRRWWVAIGGHPDRQDLRHVRDKLRAGFAAKVIREVIADRVRDERIRAGGFVFDASWPPEVEEESTTGQAVVASMGRR